MSVYVDILDFTPFQQCYWRHYFQIKELERAVSEAEARLEAKVKAEALLEAEAEAEANNLNNAQDALCKAADKAVKELLQTDYGAELEDSLKDILSRLERGLNDLIKSMKDSEDGKYKRLYPSMLPYLDPYHVRVRAFYFWGRIAGILNRYRDNGQGISKNEFDMIIQDIRTDTKALMEKIEAALLLNIFHVAYSPKSMLKIDKALDDLNKIYKFFSENLEAGMGERSRDFFREDFRFIPRQFIDSIALLCFELFGHVEPETLRLLLNVKISTAERLGLTHWNRVQKALETPLKGERVPELRESMDPARELRRQVGKLRNIAERRATKGSWEMLNIIKYCENHSLYLIRSSREWC